MQKHLEACDAENCDFQMLKNDEIVTSVQEESDTVNNETDDDEDNSNNESIKGPSKANAFSALEAAMEWYEQQSAVPLSYCCSRESEILQQNTQEYNRQRKKSDYFPQ
ncbi:hypothetical protein TNCV_3364791 [Trichonephila clavipes]|nr:hypothetical protein TNCV_3364791 [Trichonephila clavipes]